MRGGWYSSWQLAADKAFGAAGGPGSVYRDGPALATAELARKIAAITAKRGVMQAAAAEVPQLDQPKVSL
jgi:hypothetical protein